MSHRQFIRSIFPVIVLCTLAIASFLPAATQNAGPLQQVPAIPVRSGYDQFRILLWQYCTSEDSLRPWEGNLYEVVFQAVPGAGKSAVRQK